jgi:hypothetical protein
MSQSGVIKFMFKWNILNRCCMQFSYDTAVETRQASVYTSADKKNGSAS